VSRKEGRRNQRWDGIFSKKKRKDNDVKTAIGRREEEAGIIILLELGEGKRKLKVTRIPTHQKKLQ